MKRCGSFSIYEFGGLGAKSICEFEDRGKTRLDLVPFDPDQLPRGDPGRLGELLLQNIGR